MAEHVPVWQDGPSDDVTVEHLLAMTSGRRWTYDLDYGRLVRRAAGKTAFALGVGQEDEPGAAWEYDNIAVQVLEEVLTSSTGSQVRDLARTRLFEPIGLRDTTWDTDADGSTTTYPGIRSSCDDLARLGLLVARGGQWDGEQVVPSELVDRLTGTSSSELNAAYGGPGGWTRRVGCGPSSAPPGSARTGPRARVASRRTHPRTPGGPSATATNCSRWCRPSTSSRCASARGPAVRTGSVPPT